MRAAAMVRAGFRPRIHRASTIRLHGSPGEAISIDAFIEEARSEISTAELRSLGEFRIEIESKLFSEQGLQHRDLHEGVEVLLDAVSSSRALSATDPLPDSLAEAGVALKYLLKGMDLIPDQIPEIGLTDDARIVARVIERNPDLVRSWRSALSPGY